MSRRVTANRDGTYQVQLPDGERELLVALVPQLREMLVGAVGRSQARIQRLATELSLLLCQSAIAVGQELTGFALDSLGIVIALDQRQ